jgi:prepilin-type N-terminal cleavage/methylation domain-containing protein
MKRLNAKKGFTLAELVVVMVVFGIIQAAAFTFFMTSLRATAYIHNTTAAQSEMRAMLTVIQRQVRVATKAEIKYLSAPPGPGDVSGWSDGTLVFYAGVDTGAAQKSLVVREVRAGALNPLSNAGPNAVAWQYRFNGIEGLEINFEPSDVINADGDANAGYAVKVDISVTGNRTVKNTKFTDSFALVNLKQHDPPEELVASAVPTPPADYPVLIITPAKSLTMSP